MKWQMSTLVLELSETVTRTLEKQYVSQQEIQKVALAAIELWLAHRVRMAEDSHGDWPFSQSAVPFVRRLISQNRELFEELAQW